MKKNVQIEHESMVSARDFEDFTMRLELELKRFDAMSLKNILDDPRAAAERLKDEAGDERLMLFDIRDHGSLLALSGRARKAKQYMVGNPLVAAKMTRHDVRAGLYAPLRLFVFEGADGATNIEFDLPSSLFGQFKNAGVDEVARTLDQKIYDLIAKADGNPH